MADHIPFITGDEVCHIVRDTYSDSAFVRLPLEKARKHLAHLHPATRVKVWLDPGVDGMHDLAPRRSTQKKANTWFNFMSHFPHFEEIATSDFHARPTRSKVEAFVGAILDNCNEHDPDWITIPQFPLVEDSTRNKINRELAGATARWKISGGFRGHLILPLVFTNQKQLNGKTERNPKVQQAERCYREAQADGFWVVDASLEDDSGSVTLRNKRFPGVIALHEELNAVISSSIRIAGPYWALNLVLWARGLVDYPAIGVGSGYQYYITGSPGKMAKDRLALRPLRRRAITAGLAGWLDDAIKRLAPSHPAHTEFSRMRKELTALRVPDSARKQVAKFYKEWFDTIAAVPEAGRSMALFQDLATAFALGRSLPNLPDTGTARSPWAVAEALMLSCL